MQRFLTAKSIEQGRQSLMISAFFKIPLQIIVPLIGVLVFAFYVFAPAPLLFNGVHDARVRASARAADYAAVEQQYRQAVAARKTAAEDYAHAREAGAAEAAAAARTTFAARDADVTKAPRPVARRTPRARTKTPRIDP